jgi:RNA polymerase sigma-70 factor (ECF subfamily)
MASAQDGDHGAYARLLEEVAPYLRRLISHRLRNAEDIEDTVQDILLTVHAIRHTYDPRRPFGPWLVTIARRRVADRVRRHVVLRAREVPLNAWHETLSGVQANLPEEIADGRRLHDVIETLPSAQRWAVKLLKLRQLSLREAAQESGMSIAALKVAGHRALKALRAKLIAHED